MDKTEFREKVNQLYNGLRGKGLLVHAQQVNETEFHFIDLNNPSSFFGGGNETYCVFLDENGDPTYVILG